MPVHPLCVPSGLMREEENMKQRTGDHEINFLLFVTGNRRQETAGKVINNHSPLWKLNVRLWRGEVQGGRLGRRWENRKGSRITPPKQDNSPRGQGTYPASPGASGAPGSTDPPHHTLSGRRLQGTKTQSWGGRSTNRTHHLLTWGARGEAGM